MDPDRQALVLRFLFLHSGRDSCFTFFLKICAICAYIYYSYYYIKISFQKDIPFPKFQIFPSLLLLLFLSLFYKVLSGEVYSEVFKSIEFCKINQ